MSKGTLIYADKTEPLTAEDEEENQDYIGTTDEHR
jgi:hypothetical protein